MDTTTETVPYLRRALERKVHDQGFIDCIRLIAERGEELEVDADLIDWADGVLDLHERFQNAVFNPHEQSDEMRD